ncbi:MAG: hypothetical protein ACRENN_05985 [Candidatus Eiseniibacteriota bacterium]
MPKRWESSLLLIAAVGMITMAFPAAYGAVPSTSKSFYVPQAGSTTAPLEGASSPNPSFRFFRSCPNNDGGASLPNNARIKVVVRDGADHGIAGIAAADILLLFNGGTPEQGFSSPGGPSVVGADSIIANAQFNQTPLCPDVRFVQADDQTDATGTTFITFTGSTPGSPGVGKRDPLRKWGHYDTEIPLYVVGLRISGRLTTASANGTYTLRIKSFDWTGGLGTALNQGETVTSADFNGVAVNIGVDNAISYWKDFDHTGGSGAVGVTDFNAISLHVGHNCGTPNNP